MEANVLKKLFFALMMCSCAKHSSIEQLNKGGAMKFAGENFSSTNSPCLDGILTAIDHSCAVPMQIEEGYPYVMIQCTKVRPGQPEWNIYNILAVTNPVIEDPADAIMLCMDPYARIYAQKRP